MLMQAFAVLKLGFEVYVNVCYKLTRATAVHYLASSSCFQCLLCLTNTIFCSFQDQWDLYYGYNKLL